MSLSWRCVRALGQLRPALRPAAVAQLNRCSSTSTPGSGSDSGMYEPEGIQEPWIPAYEPRADEHTETKRSRLLYQSRKRGMLENGLVLSTFASRYLAGMTAPQLEVYDKLINQPSNDWDIYYWATGVRETPAEFESEIMTMLKEFIKNKGKESRIAQPGLYDKFEEKA